MENILESQVELWDLTVRSLPTFEEFRDLEFVRRSGRINMLTQDVQRELYDRGRYAGVTWLQRCKDNGISWTNLYRQSMDFYEAKHGLSHTWYTPELLSSWEASELDDEEAQLRRRLREIEIQKREKSGGKGVG